MPDDTLPRSILGGIGLVPEMLSPLGLGLASEAWAVRTDGRDAVLRVSRYGPDEPTTYRSEHALMSALRALGAAVPTPVTGDWQQPAWSLPAFSLTTFLPGRTPDLLGSPQSAARMAAFLGQLHGIARSGFGPLAQEDEVRGSEPDPIAGVRGRWSGLHAWLVDDVDIEGHPAMADHRDLVLAVAALASDVRTQAVDEPMVLVHSDLHEENVLETSDGLAFIDFGETFVGSAAWEFASIAYFLGWPTAEAILAAYGSGIAVGPSVRQVARLALSFGLSRWEQDRDMGVDGDEHDATFLRASLARV